MAKPDSTPSPAEKFKNVMAVKNIEAKLGAALHCIRVLEQKQTETGSVFNYGLGGGLGMPGNPGIHPQYPSGNFPEAGPWFPASPGFGPKKSIDWNKIAIMYPPEELKAIEALVDELSSKLIAL